MPAYCTAYCLPSSHMPMYEWQHDMWQYRSPVSWGGGGQLPRSDNRPGTLWSPATSYVWSPVVTAPLLCSGPAPTVMRHWDTGHTGQYSVFRQTPENQQQQHDSQGYPRPRLCPSRIVSRDWSGQRLQCVSSVSQPVWCDPLEVSRIHSVRSDHNLPKVIMKLICKPLDTRTQTSPPCTPMMSTCASQPF